MKAKTLVQDFGGVISKTLFETHDLSETAPGLPPATLSWKGPFDPASDELWQRMQAGEISERDYWFQRAEEVGALVGQDWDSRPPPLTAARANDPNAAMKNIHGGEACGMSTVPIDVTRPNASFARALTLLLG